MGQSQQAAEEAVEGSLRLPLLLELLSQLKQALPPPGQHPQSQPEPAAPPIRAPPAEDRRSSLPATPLKHHSEKASKASDEIELEGQWLTLCSVLIEKRVSSISSLQPSQAEQTHISCEEAGRDVPVVMLTTFDNNHVTGNPPRQDSKPFNLKVWATPSKGAALGCFLPFKVSEWKKESGDLGVFFITSDTPKPSDFSNMS
ncbi:putative transcriptional regulatory protein [Dissostichus eleginoides]|uniref:Transcriptional regulatory protein n=1 Tax=Dissostichus eleginoides TaxID=100907 RepID=A0AAD9F9A8_DISEL|nr:putative transcriptional regulatory protein [Dissostichus eleginoides]